MTRLLIKLVAVALVSTAVQPLLLVGASSSPDLRQLVHRSPLLPRAGSSLLSMARHLRIAQRVPSGTILQRPSGWRSFSMNRGQKATDRSLPKQSYPYGLVGQLRVPDSAFSPAVISFDKPINNVTQSLNHSKTWDLLHRLGAYEEDASYQNALFYYVGSVFPDSASSSAAYEDAVQTVEGKGVANDSCNDIFNVPCRIFAGTTTDNLLQTYFVISVNYCLIETASLKPMNDKTLDTLVTNIQTLVTVTAEHLAQSVCVGAGPQVATVQPTRVAAPTIPPTISPPTVTPSPVPTAIPTTVPTNTPINFDVLAAHVQRTSVNDLTARSVKKAKAGQKVFLYLYFTVRSSPGPLTVIVTFTIKSGGNAVMNRNSTMTLSSVAPHDYASSLPYTLPKKHGKYSFVGHVTIEGVTKKAQVHFSIT